MDGIEHKKNTIDTSVLNTDPFPLVSRRTTNEMMRIITQYNVIKGDEQWM